MSIIPSLQDLMTRFPNDQELGAVVREIFSK